MKLSEMTPDANPLHQYFKTAVEEFHKTEAWKALLHVHMKVEVLDWGAEEAFQPKEDERGEFNYMKYVKQKLQIFRYYGDLLQTEQSKDPQTYAAPEGHVEAEIRPERLNGDKKDRPRINVYVPSLASKDVQDNYTKRNASDSETYFLCICLRAGQQLRELRDKLQPRPPPPQKGDDNEKPDPLFEPFEMEVEVPSIEGGVVRVRLSHPCRLSRQARKCIYCSRRREGLARCAGCKVVYYCSPEHQKLDWKAGHKQACPKHADASKTELTTWDATLPRLEETSLDLFAPESIDALEQFHASQEPVVPVTAMLRHVFEDNVGNESVQKLSALPKAGAPVDSWSTLFDACGLNAESDVEAGVLLSNVLSVYHAIMNMSPKLRETFEAKDEFVIHIPDACLEPTFLDTFRLLLDLLPGDWHSVDAAGVAKKRLRLVFIGRRMESALQYRVVQWPLVEGANDSTGGAGAKGLDRLRHTEAEPTGKMGDIWRGADNAPLAARFYAEDYPTFLKKTEGAAAECHLVVMLNAHSCRHNFFHSTSHACVGVVQSHTPLAAFCYTQADAEHVHTAMDDVARKETKPQPLAAPTHQSYNPFRSPLRGVSDYPVPCHPNAYVVAWL